jgi:nucleoside-diphosphate-sugar epimerase
LVAIKWWAKMINQKNILITGGAGFVGANLARKLISDSNFRVFIIEKKNTDSWRLKDISAKININYVDLENYDELSKTVGDIKPDIVFHFASYGVYPSLQSDVNKMVDVNIKGTLNLINSLEELKLDFFINTSTCF